MQIVQWTVNKCKKNTTKRSSGLSINARKYQKNTIFDALSIIFKKQIEACVYLSFSWTTHLVFCKNFHLLKNKQIAIGQASPFLKLRGNLLGIGFESHPLQSHFLFLMEELARVSHNISTDYIL